MSPTHAPQSAAAGEWKQGWPLVLSAAAGMAVSSILLYTTGLFIEPLEAEFGWSRAAIASGMTVNAVVTVLLSPLAGALVDRLGPRRVGITGVMLFCLLFSLLATNGGSLLQWWLLWFFLSLATLALKSTVWVAAVTSRFETARGMAIACTLCGSSLTAIVAPLATGWIIEHYGWRAAYVGLALIWGTVVLPLLAAFFYGSADLSRTSTAARGTLASVDRSQIPGVAAKEAFRSASYIKLSLACVISYFAISGAIVNLVPMLSVLGIPRIEATSAVSFVGVGSLMGRLLAGSCLDRYSAETLGTIVFGLPAIGFGILLSGNVTLGMAFVVALIFGIAAGTEIEIASFLIARYFGQRHFGLLFGTLAGLLITAGGLGPPVFGHIYDEFGSYHRLIILALPLPICAGLLTATLIRRPKVAVC